MVFRAYRVRFDAALRMRAVSGHGERSRWQYSRTWDLVSRDRLKWRARRVAKVTSRCPKVSPDRSTATYTRVSPRSGQVLTRVLPHGELCWRLRGEPVKPRAAGKKGAKDARERPRLKRNRFADYRFREPSAVDCLHPRVTSASSKRHDAAVFSDSPFSSVHPIPRSTPYTYDGFNVRGAGVGAGAFST